MIKGSRRHAVITALLVMLLSSFAINHVAFAQDVAPAHDASQNGPVNLLEDFIHYVLVANPELADGSARALFDSGISDADLYRLLDQVDADRFEDALQRAMRMDALADVAGQLDTRIRSGRRDVARDPAEIARNIALLSGSARARMMAREALKSAGEYAVPQLLHLIIGPSSQKQKTDARLVLIEIGRQAVSPLATSLPSLDPVSQERACQILAELQYRHALPALHDIAVNPATQPSVAEAANSAFLSLDGDPAATSTDLWLELAEEYWSEAMSLVAWPGEDTANVWQYDVQNGLYATPVPSEIFAEIMVMRSAKSALTADRDSLPALALWIAANFRRSDQLPGGLQDPINNDLRSPAFYAVLAGPDADQLVLARAINDLSTPLARHAIAALRDTAGSANLWAAGDQAAPLIDALTFPERRVRYDAAMALGLALPNTQFEGSERVVPIFASAIRTGSRRFAAVIADKPEDQRAIASNLQAMGFSVLPPRTKYSEIANDLIGTVGVDLFAVMQPSARFAGTINSIHNDSRVSASPIMLLVPGTELDNVRDQIREQFEGDRRIGFVRLGLNQSQMTKAVTNLVERNAGPMITAEEADRYAADALRILRDIAVSNTPAYHVTQASPALVEALDSYTGDLRMTAAQTLSWIGTAEAQQALLRAALNENQDVPKMVLLDLVSDSARRFGSMIDDSQLRKLSALVENATGALSTAAAKTYGALNLRGAAAVRFITD